MGNVFTCFHAMHAKNINLSKVSTETVIYHNYSKAKIIPLDEERIFCYVIRRCSHISRAMYSWILDSALDPTLEFKVEWFLAWGSVGYNTTRQEGQYPEIEPTWLLIFWKKNEDEASEDPIDMVVGPRILLSLLIIIKLCRWLWPLRHGHKFVVHWGDNSAIESGPAF